MKKRIGVDIDAVLTNEGRGENNIWHQNICNYFELEKRKKDVYSFTEAYDLTEEEIEEFIAAKGLNILKNIPPRPKCQKVLNQLKDMDYKIILITARLSETNQLTLEWLDKHNIPFDKLIHSREKAKTCQQERIDLFIEDNLEHALPIKKIGIPVLLMNMHHNQHYQHEDQKNIYRVNNWEEIKENISNILKIKLVDLAN